MAYDNLPAFVAELEHDGDLVRIAAEVDPVHEIAEITSRVSEATGGGPAIFFENVRGHSIPVVTNLLGSARRMCRALRASSFEDVSCRVAGLIRPSLPDGWIDSLKLIPQMAELTRMPPKSVRTGICQQVVNMGRDVDLGELPILRSWPGEGAPVITAGQVYTQDPGPGVRNVGLYPLQVRDRNSLYVHCDPHQGGWRDYEQYRSLGQQMPIAVVLGGDPVYTYMASAPLPAGMDECLLGGFLRGSNVEMVKCRSIDLEVPADAEIVLEGMIDTTVPLEEAGPIGRATGFYGPRERVPAMHVTAVTHRSNPIYPAIVVGRPPMEDYWIQKASERILLPFLRVFVPEVLDINLPRPGVFKNLLFVQIRKQYPQHARKIMNSLWSMTGLATSKFVVVVDQDVDVQDEESVWFAVGSHCHPGRDVVFFEGPASYSDHAAPTRGVGHKMGIDATRKLPEEGHTRSWPDSLESTQEIAERVAARWSNYGLGGLGGL